MNKVAVCAVNHHRFGLSRQINQWRVKAVVSDCAGKKKKPQRLWGSHGSFKVSPYGADHNLLPHLKRPEVGTRCRFTFRETQKRSAALAVRGRETTATQRSLEQKMCSSLMGFGWGWSCSLAVDTDSFPFKTQHSAPGIMNPAADWAARHSCSLSLQSS